MKKSILFSVFVLMLSISIVDTCQGQNATNYIMSNYRILIYDYYFDIQ